MSLGQTPVDVFKLKELLKNYPDTEDAMILKDGFENGFSLNYRGPRVPKEANNLKSINEHLELVKEKIAKKVASGLVAGPFKTRPISTLRVSPLGIIPKKQPGEYRIIHHLSYPENNSVNDFIDPALCSVTYTSFDEAVNMVQKLGQNTLLAKSDIKSAFDLLIVKPGDFDLLGFKLEDQYYFSKTLPMGGKISCALFEKFAKFIEYCVRDLAKSDYVIHYLDDFLFAGKPDTLECNERLNEFRQICDDLGVPIANEKTEGPSTVLQYLGLIIDTKNLLVRIPLEKIKDLTLQIEHLLAVKKATLRELQSLIGSLNFACRAIRQGRPFIRRLINAISNLKRPHYLIRINKGMRLDLKVWLDFFKQHNGISVFYNKLWVSNADIQLFSDSSGSKGNGFGLYFNGKWAYARWPDEWFSGDILQDITFLEFFPIVVALLIWGPILRNKKIIFRSDNLSVVHIINSLTSKSERVMRLVRKFTFLTLGCNVLFKSEHVSGKNNILTDKLSRMKVEQFLQLAPQAEPCPTHIPTEVWEL